MRVLKSNVHGSIIHLLIQDNNNNNNNTLLELINENLTQIVLVVHCLSK